MNHDPVPGSWWRATCEVVRHPIACVNSSNYFVWANAAFERLVGYSQAELSELTWMDITATEDLGADLKNVRAVIAGEDMQYTMLKNFIHKRGHKVKICLSVWRHPSDYREFVCFIVEAMPEPVTASDIRSVESSLTAILKAVEQRVSRLEKDEVMDHQRSETNVNVGNSTNSVEVLRWIVVAVIAVVGAVSYLIYIAGWPYHDGRAQPPTHVQPESSP